MTSELSTIATVQFGELRLFGKLSMFMPIFPEFRKLVKKIQQRNTRLKRYCRKVCVFGLNWYTSVCVWTLLFGKILQSVVRGFQKPRLSSNTALSGGLFFSTLLYQLSSCHNCCVSLHTTILTGAHIENIYVKYSENVVLLRSQIVLGLFTRDIFVFKLTQFGLPVRIL